MLAEKSKAGIVEYSAIMSSANTLVFNGLGYAAGTDCEKNNIELH